MALVMGAFLLNFTTDLTVPAEAFLARETFGAGSVGYGLLVSVWGGGMIVGSALAAVLENRLNLIILYLVSIFIWGLALVGTGLAPAFVIALGALAVAGVSNGVDNVATDTVLQRRVPDIFLGRVFSVRFLGYTVGEALAYQVGGMTMDATGPRFVCTPRASQLLPRASSSVSAGHRFNREALTVFAVEGESIHRGAPCTCPTGQD